MLTAAERPVMIVGNGARPFREAVLALAERIDAPVITTFKAKGLVPDGHPLACGVLGRSGTPVGSAVMARSDCLLVLGASFSNHTGIATYVPTIQVDADRMTLGKFHPVDVPLWGDIGRTLTTLQDRLPPAGRPEQRQTIARRTERWRDEKRRRAAILDGAGRMHPAAVFEALSAVAPEDAVIAVDVGNNAYAFGHYFECKPGQDVLMSGYLGSIGFGFPAAMGAWAAAGGTRKVIAVTGDGGFGQYLAEFTTAVKYGMSITHVLLNNSELGKISREQVSAIRPVWQTDLVNPDFAAYAESCGGRGFRVDTRAALEPALREAMAVSGGPALVEVRSSAQAV
jgi:thiamine pyrophosphate-dependent acetolactate synthase large subunit-like protein